VPHKFDALRAEVWKMASDDQLLESELVARYLALLGARLAARHVLVLVTEDQQLLCKHDWHAEGLRSVHGLVLPVALGPQLLKVAGCALSTDALGEAGVAALGPGQLLAVGCPFMGRIRTSLVLTRELAAEAWPAPALPFLAEAVGIACQAIARRRAELAMRQSELRYRIISELSSDWAFSLTVGKDGTPSLDWGTPTKGPVGERVRQSLAGLFARSRSESRDRATDLFERCRKGEAAVDEFEVTGGTGETRFMEVATRPVMDAVQGRVVRIFGLARDVTERVLAGRAVKRERDLMRAVLEASPDGIILASLKDEVIDCNTAAFTVAGCSTREEMLGRSVFSLLAEKDRPRARELQEAVRAGKSARGIRWHGRTVDGREFPMQLSLGLVRSPEGSPYGFVAVVKNLTEQVELDARLLRTQKAESLTALASGVANDFNNLLAAILGNAELARETLAAGAKGHEELGQICLAAERAAGLSHQLLDYTGRGRLAPEPLDLSALMSETTALLESSISKKCTLKCELARALPPVEADPRQLRQVALNLVVNASEAIGERSGTVALRTCARRFEREALSKAALGDSLPAGEYVILEVDDDGCGMSPQTLARIFDPFFTTKSPGRGLGLAAVQGAVVAHRGGLVVESEPGGGSTFRVLLPAAHGASLPARAPTASPGGAPARGARQGKVLLADDEELVRYVAQTILERAGFTVVGARDGREALDLFAQAPESFHLVLLDYRMPRLDGVEALREIRKARRDLPVLFSSGQPDAAGAPEKDPLLAFMPKPFTRDELIAQVDRLLARAHAARPA